MSFMKEEYENRYRKEHEIACPFCEEVQSNDDNGYPVTYWGEDLVEFECQQCGKKFWVKEIVDRTYDVSKINDF